MSLTKSKFAAKLAAGVSLAVAVTLTPTVASATAFAYDAYAPKKVGGTVQGWANLERDCSGTQGCRNYMKIEKRNWWGPSYVGGAWVSQDGWNSVTVDLPAGCGDYRTWVDSYNDVVGAVGNAANLGPVGLSSSGEQVYRWKRTWNSGWARLCR